MYQLHQSVESILTPGGASWSSTCMDVPIVLTAEVEDAFAGDDFFSTEDEDDEWKEVEEVEEEDPSVVWYGEAYCQVVESMPRACLERSILELWGKVSGSCLTGFCSQLWLHADLEKWQWAPTQFAEIWRQNTRQNKGDIYFSTELQTKLWCNIGCSKN